MEEEEMSVISKDGGMIGTITVAALIVGLLPITVEAGMLREDGRPMPTPQSTSNTTGQPRAVNTKTRPCSDFLKAQGTTSKFFPPVPDYVGWADKLFTTFGLVDYAGLAAEYINQQTGKSLGTKVTCLVTEEALTGGRAKIGVALSTTKALGFAQSIADLTANSFDFLNTPTIFGAKAQDVVVDGAKPALGPATLDVSFHIPQPGRPLPDLVDVLVDHPCVYRPVTVQFDSFTYAPDGTQAVLHIS
jgi:hypothetical protein